MQYIYYTISIIAGSLLGLLYSWVFVRQLRGFTFGSRGRLALRSGLRVFLIGVTVFLLLQAQYVKLIPLVGSFIVSFWLSIINL